MLANGQVHLFLHSFFSLFLSLSPSSFFLLDFAHPLFFSSEGGNSPKGDL